MGPNINTTQPQETSQSSPFSITKESLLEPFRHLNNISNGGKFITAKLYQNSFIIFPPPQLVRDHKRMEQVFKILINYKKQSE